MWRILRLVLLPLVVIGLLLAIKDPFQRLIVRRYVLSQVERVTGNPILYNNISYDGNTILIDRPLFSASDGSYSITAEQLRIDYDILFNQRELIATIDVVHPKVFLDNHELSSHQGQELIWWSAWLSSHVTLKVDHGEVAWRDQDNVSPVATFDMILQNGTRHPKGTINLSVVGKGNRHAQITFDDTAAAAKTTIRMQGVPANLAMALSSGFSGFHLPFRTTQGSLSGLWQWQGEQSFGQLTLENVVANVSKTPIQIRIKEAKLAGTPSMADENASAIQVQGAVQVTSTYGSWTLEGLKGQLSLNSDDYYSFSCRGQWRHSDELKALRLDGGGKWNSAVHGILSFIDPKGGESRIELWHQDDQDIRAKFSNVDASEISLLKDFFAYQQPEISAWKIIRGRFNGSLMAKPQRVEISHLAADSLEVRHLHMGWMVRLDKGRGHLSVDRMSGFATALDLEGGSLSVEEEEDTVCLLSHIDGQITVGPGDSRLNLRGKLTENQGSFELSYQDDLNLSIHTCGSFVARYFPSNLREHVMALFLDEPLLIQTTVRGERVRGNFLLGEQKTPQVSFSLDLLQSLPATCYACVAGQSLTTVWGDPLRQFSSAQSPEKEAPFFRNGRLEIAPIKLQRLMANQECFWKDLQGTVKVKGTFDAHQTNLALHFTDLCLDTPVAVSQPIAVTAQMCINRDSQAVSFRLPFSHLTIFDKVHGLSLVDAAGTFAYQNDRIMIKGFDVAVEGVLISGDIVSSPLSTSTDLLWEFTPELFSGTVSQVASVLRHFDDRNGLLQKLPLQGMVSLRGSSSKILFNVTEAGSQWQGKVLGELREGMLASMTSNLAVRELVADFSYDIASNVLDISDVQGTLLVGQPGRNVEEYVLASDKMRVAEYPYEHVFFDVTVVDKSRDVLRVSGEASTQMHASGYKEIQFAFDRDITHFSCVHPTIFDLRLNDWSQVAFIDFKIEVDLQKTLKDLQWFSRAGLPFVSQRVVDELQNISAAKGSLAVLMEYNRHAPIFSYHIKGRDIALNDHVVNMLQLSGSIQGNNWIVDQFQVDDLSFAADLTQMENRWKVNFLGARCSKALTIGMDGEYFPDNGVFHGRLNLLEMNLSQLKRWGYGRRFAKRFQPNGDIRAQGKVDITVLPSPEWFHLSATVDTQMRGVELGGVRFRDATHIKTEVDSHTGCVFHAIRTMLLPTQPGGRPVVMELDRLAYHLAQNSLSIEGGRFKAPDGAMGWVADALKGPLGPTGHQLAHRMVEKISSTSGTNGSFEVAFTPGNSSLQMQIDGGTYMYEGKPYLVKDLTVDFSPYELKVGALVEYAGNPLWVKVLNQCPPSPYGELLLSDRAFVEAAHRPMVVSWEYDATSGFTVKQVKGELFGFNAALMARGENGLQSEVSELDGTVWVDLATAAPLISDSFAKNVQACALKASYLLDGTWMINHLDTDWIHFSGMAKAENWEIGGYQLNSLTTHLEMTPSRIKFTDMLILDPAGNVKVGEATITNVATQDWRITIPAMCATNVTPSGLKRSQESSHHRRHDIVFPELMVTDIRGSINDMASFTADGYASFHYSNKKRGKGLLGFTSDFMSGLGLDWDVITPSSGSIEYAIKDGRILLTRLKDVYSQGKLAKYSLPKEGKVSSVDFKGNLDITIKLRPHQPLLKVTEKMTLMVGGNLKKPTFAVH